MALPRRVALVALIGGMLGCGVVLGLGENDAPTPAKIEEESGAEDAGGADGSTSTENAGGGNDAASEADADAASEAGADGAVTPVSKRIFVTRRTAPGTMLFANSTLSGVAGADEECNRDAADAGVSGTFVAWLSTPALSAKSRVSGSAKYVLMDGNVAFQTINLIQPSVPLDKTALNTAASSIGSRTWTGTLASNGAVKVDFHCSAWESTNGSGYTGTFASGGGTTINWTENSAAACTDSYPVYCFEQ